MYLIFIKFSVLWETVYSFFICLSIISLKALQLKLLFRKLFDLCLKPFFMFFLLENLSLEFCVKQVSSFLAVEANISSNCMILNKVT